MLQNNSKSTDSMKYREALCDSRYNRSLFIIMINTLALAFNGANTLSSYGQVILGRFFGNTPEAKENVELVLNLILVIEIAAFFFSIFSVNLGSRRLLILSYSFLIGLLNLLLGVLGYNKDAMVAISVVILAIFFI